MDIKVISSEDIDFKEKDIQKAFESDLTRLEDGLELVASEVTLGTGRVDTLAFDTENSQPVFIEYKGRGQFGKDALIQLMDYLSWFARYKNHMAILEKFIRAKKPDLEEFEPEIRLICIVSDIEDRIRNAIYAITNWIRVYSYMLTKSSKDDILLVPKLEVDNQEIERQVRPGSSEADILGRHPHLRDLFTSLRPHLEKEGIIAYTTSRSFRFKKERVFAKVHFRKRYILLELRVGQNKVNDTDFKYWKKGLSKWGYTYLYPSNEIQRKIINWIEIALEYSSEHEENEGVEDQG